MVHYKLTLKIERLKADKTPLYTKEHEVDLTEPKFFKLMTLWDYLKSK